MTTNPEYATSIVEAGGLTVLIALLRSSLHTVQQEAVSALANLSMSEEWQLAIVAKGALMPLVLLLRSNMPALQEMVERHFLARAARLADAWAAGVCLFALLATRLPFGGAEESDAERLALVPAAAGAVFDHAATLRAGGAAPWRRYRRGLDPAS